MFTAPCEPRRLARMLMAFSVSSVRHEGAMTVTVGHHDLLGATVIIQTRASVDATIVSERPITRLIQIAEPPRRRVF
jgi:hypothetical protein